MFQFKDKLGIFYLPGVKKLYKCVIVADKPKYANALFLPEVSILYPVFWS